MRKTKMKDSGLVVVTLPGVDTDPFPKIGKDPSWIFRMWKFQYHGKTYQLNVVDDELTLVKVK